MKLAVFLIVVVGVVVAVMYIGGSSTEDFDPTEQGLQARAAVKMGVPWTEVLEVAGEPRHWRDEPSGFDFHYVDRFDSNAREVIAKGIEEDDYPYGFSFLYRFSDSATFAVNFDRKGMSVNIQDKESKKDLMEDLGG